MQVLRTYCTRLFFGWTILFLSMATARAGNGGGNNSFDGGGGGSQVKALAVLDGSQHQIQPDSTMTVVDSSFFDPSLSGLLSNKSYTVQNAITVMINESSTRYMHTQWTVTLKLLITTTDSAGTVDTVTRNFTVGYDSVGTYSSRNTYAFQGAHKVTVKVVSDSTDATGWDPTSVLVVENQLSTRPAFVFNCQTTIGTITVSPSTDTTADELPVSWDAILGADQYDLEWTYIYDSALVDGRYGAGPNYNPALIFRNNSTRVTITGNSYNIPLIYDDYGKLFIRVRPVELGNAGAVTNAIWSSDASPVVMGVYAFSGHQRSLNWQSNISYAEEGKRKVVLQYYDGSLRSRQTVTKDNTTNTTIVGETYYDYQGRPSIQVMPAPTLNSVIKYTAGFNVSFNSAEYNQSNYDTLTSVAYCDAHADSMSYTAGASQYYSPGNPQANQGLNQFIPNAEDYPFTETEYTPDNTGRISRQGGVGLNHQLGSGHETKYYYGTPDQYELDGLFGTEVGDKSHYFKNMVRDANGQYSVSYVDMHGRTIATALSGAQPQGMSPLASNSIRTITETLADSSTASVRGLSMISQKSLVVSQGDTYNFSYSLLPDSLQQANCQSTDICYTCRYDLNITITDNCNNQAFGGQPYTVSKHNFSLATLATLTDPHTDTAMDFNFSVALPEGSYVVTKQLTIDQDTYNYYRDSIYMPNNTCTSLSQLLTSQKSVIASKLTSCTASCSDCLANVGSFATFLASYNKALGLSSTDTTYQTEAKAAYQSALSACSAVCQISSDVDDIQNAMLQDMTPPFGQYADSSQAPDDKYSIFYVATSDTGYVPLFKLSSVVYHDDNGKPDSVYDAESGLMVTPNNLTKEEFVAAFRPSWAKDLLIYHPDYCRLKVMQGDSASYSFDRRMQSLDTYAAANDSGFLNPLKQSVPLTTGSDPIYGTSVKGDLQSAMMSYQNIQSPNKTMTIWGLAVALVKCSGITDSLGCTLHYAKDGAYPYGFNDPSLCAGDQDMAWRNFRQMYLQKKQDLVYKDILAKPSGCTVANVRAYSGIPAISTLLGDQHTSSFTQLSDQLGQQDGPLKYLSNINGPTSAGNAQSNIQDSLNTFYSLNVNAYAQQWYQQLTSSCKLYVDTNDVKATLIPALKSLCLEACDADHPYGASTLPSGATPITFEGQPCTSFTQIVNLYDQSKSITDQVHCNAELINSPLPYDNQPVYTVKPEIGRPSDCECSIITGLFDQYSVSHFGDSSFSAFLLRTQHVTMSGSDLNSLLGMCDNTTNTLSCNNNETPIYLPPVMQCHAGQTCSSCQAIDSLYGAFKVAYPGILPSDSSDIDTAQSIKNQLFQNYMNNRLGYSLQFWEYLQFMDTCNAHATDTVTSTNCSPVTIAKEFKSGAGSTDNMISISSTTDGGYALAGYKGILGHLDTAYLMRYNSAGRIQWANTYITTGGSNFWKVRSTSDGGFVAAGADFTSGGAFVVKANADGTTAWQHTISLKEDARADQAFDIIQTSDGGYAVVGDHNIGYPYTGPATILCMKLDSLGNVLWAKGFGHGDGNDGYAVAENNDTLVVVGRQSSSLGGVQGVLLKVGESTGTLLNSVSIKDSSMVPGSSGDYYGLQAFGIVKTTTGYHLSDYVSDGGNGDNGRFGFVDLGFDNSLKKASRIGLPPGNTVDDKAAGNIVPTPDGGWLCGETTGNTLHISLVKLDSSANVSWSRESILPGSQTFGSSVQNLDGTFAALGTEESIAMVANLSSSGSTKCYDSVVTIGTDSPSIKISFAVQTDSSFTAVISGTLAVVTPTVISDSAFTCSGSTNCYVAYNGPLLCGKAAPMLTPTVASVTTCSDSTFFTVSTATSLFSNYTDSLTGDFEQRYLVKCMNAYKHETFTVSHHLAEYHYTLYYYDQAGNLLKTVPPAGVEQVTDTNWLKDVAAARASGTSMTPHHTLITNYRYNTLNQVITQRTPDGGGSQFWYDRLGRLAVSQNARQNPGSQYSFTEYDTIGRITQVGQLYSSTAINNDVSRSQSSLTTWLTNAMSTAEQITATTYDVANDLISDELAQRNIRNRVSYTSLYNTAADLANGSPNASASTYYSYDILGNVDTLVQDYGNGSLNSDVANIMNAYQNRFKKIVYDFDLVSGKVNQVSYQNRYADAFYHSYQYDAENRITNVQSSTDSINWDNDAFYDYYKHGPLARTVLGQQQVQGINYAYTLQGWLKAINPEPYTGTGFTLEPDSSGNVVANNAYNLLLNYYSGDYKPISNVAGPDNGVYAALGGDSLPLFNGNISSMGVNIKKLNAPLVYSYQYDQLNRLTHMDAWKRTSTAWSAITSSTDYQEYVTYDPNGNILTYHRNRENTGSSNQMDKLQYNYISGTNQLDHIYDTVSGVSNANDIATQSSGNYKYDSIGELVSDAASNITGISWTVYGKIASITKSTDTVIKYTYDPSGNRISKTVVHGSDSTVTWYVRDAQGNILSVYTYGDPAVNGGALAQTELDIYGSSRLGMWKRAVPVTNLDSTVHSPFPNSGDSINFTRGNKLFELTNHLGNVLATISDKRYGVTTDDSTVVYYNPEVVSANDYYPFGMQQYARSYTETGSGNYRFGFNGKENDNEVKGTGDQVDYGERIYDSRVGRFLSLDPFYKKFPMLTPYQYASNTPIQAIDLDGLERVNATGGYPSNDQITLPADLDISKIAYNPQANTGSQQKPLTQIDVSRVIFSSSKKCHPDGELIAKRERLEYAIAYSKLDHEHGQVDFPRSKVWGYIFGSRSTVNEIKIGDLTLHTRFYVDDNGYVTNQQVPITGTPPIDGFFPGGTSVVFKSFSAAEVGAFIATEEGAQGIEKVESIKKAIQAGDLHVWAEPLQVIEHEGQMFILNGHHRLKAFSELATDAKVSVQVISSEVAAKNYKGIFEFIKKGAFKTTIKNSH